jgi:small basic protein (TIGR04137 family)
MSVDRSLKIKGALTRHRNVLSRAERIEALKEEQRWMQEDSVFGLPKVAHRKSHAGKKAKEEKPAEALAAETGTAEAEAAPAGSSPKAGPAPKAATPAKPGTGPKEKPAKK